MRIPINLNNEAFMKTPVELMSSPDGAQISKKAQLSLRRMGFKTVGDLVEAITGSYDLPKAKGCGEATRKEILSSIINTYADSLDGDGLRHWGSRFAQLNLTKLKEVVAE